MVELERERQEAIACLEAGRFRDAADRLGRLIRSHGRTDPVLLRLCGTALVQCGQAERAADMLARHRRLAPDDPMGALWHGIALQRADRAAASLPPLRRAAALMPADPAPWLHLSRSLLVLDRPGEARDAAEAADARAPGLPEARHARHLAQVALSRDADGATRAAAWAALGGTSLHLGLVGEAGHAFEQAVALAPGLGEAVAGLARVEHLRGEPATAIARLRAHLLRDPADRTVRLALAGRLSMAGDPAGALALLDGEPPAGPAAAHWHGERARALLRGGAVAPARAALDRTRGAPVLDAGLLLCVQARQLALREGEAQAAAGLADRMAFLADQRDAGTLEHRIDAHFELGEIRERQDRPDHAFEHWRRGHALLGIAQPFSRATHAALIDRTIRAWDRDRLGRMAVDPALGRGAVFVVGLPRTGTTLLEQILAAHPRVHGAGERLAVRETLVRLAGTAEAGLAAERAAALDPSGLFEAAQDFLRTMRALSPDTPVVLDKMPDNAMQLGFIAALLPGARVIRCRRDLRDVGASIFRQRFLGSHPYAHDPADLGWFMRQHERLMAHWQAVLPLPMLGIDHADWIADFDGTLRRVLAFLELPYDPGCARFFERDRGAATASREQVRRPINADGVGRWRAHAAQLRPMLAELDANGNENGA